VVAFTLVGTSIAVVFAFLVIGLYALPPLLQLHRIQLRGVARVHERYTGVVLPTPVVQKLATPRKWVPLLRWTGTTAMSRDTWVLLGWALWDSLIGILLAAVPLGLIVWGTEGVLLLPAQYLLLGQPPSEWYTFIHATEAAALPFCVVMGAALILLGLFTAPWWLRVHGRTARRMLGGDRTALTARVDALTASRDEARRDAAAELRRIEREVHDGTQSQLVTIGLKLGTAELMLDTDPDRARALIEQAKHDSSAAVAELRDLMRGIRPPVLADRGLAAALEALSLDAPTAVTCRTAIAREHDADLETMVYFATRELVSNAIKHARASHIAIDARDTADRLVVTVDDDGVGGSIVIPGHGLDGVRRRLSTWDGTLAVTSPPGGPTSIRIEVPCAS
jgi:signal transduction histidine kinase